jgi:hypothetical protein
VVLQGRQITLRGDFAAAAARLLPALETFRALRTRWQAGQTCFELGEMERQRSAALTPAARAHDEQARGYFEALNAALARH